MVSKSYPNRKDSSVYYGNYPWKKISYAKAIHDTVFDLFSSEIFQLTLCIEMNKFHVIPYEVKNYVLELQDPLGLTIDNISGSRFFNGGLKLGLMAYGIKANACFKPLVVIKFETPNSTLFQRHPNSLDFVQVRKTVDLIEENTHFLHIQTVQLEFDKELWNGVKNVLKNTG